MTDKYFFFSGYGQALGSVMIIKAKRVADAIRIMQQEAKRLNVSHLELYGNRKVSDKPHLIYSWDGDY